MSKSLRCPPIPLALALAGVSSAACTSTQWRYDYRVDTSYGPLPEGIQVQANANSEGIRVSLSNWSDSTLVVDWVHSSIVLPSGEAVALHMAVQRDDRLGQAVPPAVLPPGAHLTKVVVPAGNVNYSPVSEPGGGWTVAPMLPGRHPAFSRLPDGPVEKSVAALGGKEFRLVLSLAHQHLRKGVAFFETRFRVNA
ncbi:MAG: hypothetical protein KC766_15060, partial [Myxococcales bacterium]|nr:hypothetical protein [Myxococcales bacterium]